LRKDRYYRGGATRGRNIGQPSTTRRERGRKTPWIARNRREIKRNRPRTAREPKRVNISEQQHGLKRKKAKCGRRASETSGGESENERPPPSDVARSGAVAWREKDQREATYKKDRRTRGAIAPSRSSYVRVTTGPGAGKRGVGRDANAPRREKTPRPDDAGRARRILGGTEGRLGGRGVKRAPLHRPPGREKGETP